MARADELKKEAEDYAEQCYGWCNNDQVTDVAVATYITSAEPREKRIADLEEENNKLLDVINNQDVKIADLEWQLQEVVKDNDNYQAENKRLEKENEELKAKNKWYSEQVCNKECAEVWGNLTKATEHIRTLISCLIDWVQEGDKDYCYIADAEQFLKEIEK